MKFIFHNRLSAFRKLSESAFIARRSDNILPPSSTGSPFRDRVDAAATERITAQYAPYCKRESPYRSPFFNCLYRIL